MQYYFRERDGEFIGCDTKSVRFSADELSEVVAKFREFLLGCGYSRDNIDEYIADPDFEVTLSHQDYEDDEEDPFAPMTGAHR